MKTKIYRYLAPALIGTIFATLVVAGCSEEGGGAPVKVDAESVPTRATGEFKPGMVPAKK